MTTREQFSGFHSSRLSPPSVISPFLDNQIGGANPDTGYDAHTAEVLIVQLPIESPTGSNPIPPSNICT
jgi:hypothetical protein